MQLTPPTKLDPPLLKPVGKVGIPELTVDGGTYMLSDTTDSSRVLRTFSSEILSGSSRGYGNGNDAEQEPTSRGSSPEPIGNLAIDQASDCSTTLDESLHTHEERLSAPREDPTLLQLPSTPLKFPPKSLDEHLDEKINNILTSLPSKVRLTAQNLRKLQNATTAIRNLSVGKGIDSAASTTHIPGPRSVVSNVSTGTSIPYSRGARERTYSGQFNASETKLYHLHRGEGQTPIKLFVRLVGSSGERVMVRIGGGWADLAEYLKEYALHHGSGRRAVSHTFEVQDLTNVASPTSKLPLPSTQNQRNASGTGPRSRGSSMSGSRPASPMLPPQSLQVPTGPKAAQTLQVSTGPRGSTTPKTLRGGHHGGLSSAGPPARPGSSLGGAMAKSIPINPTRSISSLGTTPKAPSKQIPTNPKTPSVRSTHPGSSPGGTTPKPVPTGPARPGSSLGGNNLKPVPTGPARPGSSLGTNTLKPVPTGPGRPGSSLGTNTLKPVPTGPGRPGSSLGTDTLKPVPTGPSRPGSSLGGNTLKPIPTGPSRPGSSLGGNTLKPMPTGPARPGSSLGGNTLKPVSTGPARSGPLGGNTSKPVPTGPARPGSSLAGPFPKATPTVPVRSGSPLGGSIPKSVPAHPESPLGGPPLETTPKVPSGLMASKYADPAPTTIKIPSSPRVLSTGPRTPTTTAPKLQEYTPSGSRNPSRSPSSQGYYNQNTPPQLRPPSSHRPANSRPQSSGFDTPSRPGTRPASRLSFGASEGLTPATPLGLAGPYSKSKEIPPEQQAWVDEEVRRASAQRVPSGQIAALQSSAVGDEDEDEGVGRQRAQMHKNRFGGASSGRHSQGTVVQEMGKVGNTKRVYLKKSGFAGPGNGGFSSQG